MKKHLFSVLYLLALAFSANVLADEEDYNESEKKAEGQKEEEKAEGEVEEAKNGLQLREGNVDGLFLDTVAKVVSGLLSKGGLPADQAAEIAKQAAAKVKEEHEAAAEEAAPANSLKLREANVDGLFLDTVAKVVGGLLSKGGVPKDHADAVGKHVAEKAHEEVQQEGGTTAVASNSLVLHEGNVDGLFLDTVTKVVSGLLSKGGLPADQAAEIAKQAAAKVKEEHEEAAAEPAAEPAAANSLKLHEGNVDGLFLDTVAKLVGGLLSKAGVPDDHAKATAEHIAKEAHAAVEAEKQGGATETP